MNEASLPETAFEVRMKAKDTGTGTAVISGNRLRYTGDCISSRVVASVAMRALPNVDDESTGLPCDIRSIPRGPISGHGLSSKF